MENLRARLARADLELDAAISLLDTKADDEAERETWFGPLPTRGPRWGTPWRPSERSSGSRHSTEQFIPSDVASAARELQAARTGVYAGRYSPNLVEG